MKKTTRLEILNELLLDILQVESKNDVSYQTKSTTRSTYYRKKVKIDAVKEFITNKIKEEL